MAESGGHIESQLQEDRLFAPPPEFAAQARIQSMAEYEALCAEADRDPDAYWRRQAGLLRWQTPFSTVLEWKPPFAKWFIGGKLNVSDNCLDRHADGARKDKIALRFEGEPGDTRNYTYAELRDEVARFASGLRSLGVSAGDRVAIYMPMVPEAAIAMLACTRIGATHSVVFGGFSADALRDRINDAGCKICITADGAWRRGQVVPLKQNVDAAVAQTPSITHVIVLKRTLNKVPRQARDVDWHTLMNAQSTGCPPSALDSEHPLFILYTSGTTGAPKGVVHTTAGYLLHATLSTQMVFDLKEDDIYWCTADVGWVTGHTYMVYGPLSSGATVLMYEGAPNFPEPDRFWDIIARHKVSIFYTAPTAIRAFMKWGDHFVRKHDLSSLRLLGTVGEPINPEAWMWYRSVVGGDRCPIVDTWWQTETGGIIASPLPGATPTKPGSCTLPLPGMALAVVDKAGVVQDKNKGGYLVIRKPWPSMLRTIFNDSERYRRAYFSDIPGEVYFTGDGARRDKDGYFWVMGRVDDVLNVAGHRLGTMEIESALVSHRKVAEAAVVGRNDDLKGQAVVAFVMLKHGQRASKELEAELKAHVSKEIGAIARPDDIRFAEALPKTRSGKIMRRLLREFASGKGVKGDTTTLEDFSVLESLRAGDDE